MKSHNNPSTSSTHSDDEGGSWQFKFVLFVIALSIVGLIGKVFGLF